MLVGEHKKEIEPKDFDENGNEGIDEQKDRVNENARQYEVLTHKCILKHNEVFKNCKEESKKENTEE